MGARGGSRTRRCPGGALEGAEPRQDLGDAGYAPPAASVRATDLGRAQGVLKPRHHAPSWLRYFGLTREEAASLIAAIPEALADRMLTREELAQEVGRLVGSEELGGKLRQSWGALLKPAAFRGHLLFAPSIGQNVRFARPDRWLEDWQPVPKRRLEKSRAATWAPTDQPHARSSPGGSVQSLRLGPEGSSRAWAKRSRPWR